MPINPISIVALVPMRHHSERVSNKNYRVFAGRPLYHQIINALLNCPLLSAIVIDTDSQFIMEDAPKNFPKVRIIERPPYLRGDAIPMNDVLCYDVSQVSADYYLQTHSTNPLLRSATIERALKSFLEKYPKYDSLFSVTKIQQRLWDRAAKAINHDPGLLLRTQDLQPVYQENSCLYVFGRKTLEEGHNRIGERPFMFEINRVESWDIDEELDFNIAELFFTNRDHLL